MQTYRTSRSRFAAVVAVLCLVMAQAASAVGGGNVIPPTAHFHGYTLTSMAHTAALFNSSGNDTTYYPTTPFQILYADFSQAVFTFPDDGGLVVDGGNNFTISKGTPLYVPVFSVDDSTPVLGTYPTTPTQAVHYFFDPVQIGGHDFQITVDGKTTPLGAEFLVGPVDTPPLLDFPEGGTAGTHTVALGVFLYPLSVGVHTVTISGEAFGDLIVGGYGLCYERFTFTYTVQVTPH